MRPNHVASVTPWLVWLVACSSAPPRGQAKSCNDAPLVSLEEISTGQHANERIAFEGVPVPIPMQTAMQCSSDDACCNRVDGSYSVVLKDRLVIELMGPFSCEGDECDWRCEPFGNKPAKPVRFVGTAQFEPPRPPAAVRAYATVEKFCL